jgi:hypothetical protein
MSRAVTCSSFFFEVNAVYWISATSASETQQPACSSQIARGYLIGVQASSGMMPIAALTWGFIATVTEKKEPAFRIALITAEL